MVEILLKPSMVSVVETDKNGLEYLEQCILCHSSQDQFKLYCKKSGYNIVQCKNCELIFVNPRNNQETILKQYQNNQTSPVNYYLNTVEIDKINFNKRLGWIESKVQKGKLVDIGCSVGTFMDVAKQRGWDVVGIEANSAASEICRNKNLEVYTGLFNNELVDGLSIKNVDLVCLNDSIEHFPNPLETLQLARLLIREKGFLTLNTPNILSILSRIFQIKPKEHLYYFTRGALTELLQQSGFKIVMLFESGCRRDIGSMHTGATFENQNWLYLTKLLTAVGVDRLAGFVLEKIFSDQLFILAQKI